MRMHFKANQFLVFFKYAVVGVLGTSIDVGSLYVFVEYLRIPVLIAAAGSFGLAVVNNFLLNKFWTFENRNPNIRKQFIKFSLVSLVGLGLTETFMALFVYALQLWYIPAKLVTSCIVLTWNFLANKYWTFTEKARAFAQPASAPLDLSIVIPAYNEENRIGKTIEAIEAYFRGRNITREVIVVDDGSTDDTSGVVGKLSGSINDLVAVRYTPNQGKGFAVKTGIERSRGRYILFTDADNSTPIEEFEKFRPFMNNNAVIIGSRYVSGSSVRIRQPWYRIWLGRLGNFLIQMLLFEGIRDTQCGFKALPRDAARDIFSRMKVRRFGFDMEMLAIATLLSYPIREVPVSWFNSEDSRLRPFKDAFRTFFELVYIKLNLMSGRYE
jgi:dolichyl-phosphate beta-glucosyltransferase